jgi:hypothetical protein
MYVMLCAHGWNNPLRWVAFGLSVMDLAAHENIVDHWGESTLLVFRVLILGALMTMSYSVIRKRHRAR